jgi:putative ABC transport system substrate-binding protein
MELLNQLVPRAVVVAILVNPKSGHGETQLKDVRAAVRAGQQLLVMNASTAEEIDAAFAAFARERAEALFVGPDPFYLSRRDQLVALAARHSVPVVYAWRDFPVAGGLMSYGPSITDTYRHAGNYAGRILRGEKPTDLPVVMPTKFELVINLKTAKALGIDVPPTVLARADEVIE